MFYTKEPPELKRLSLAFVDAHVKAINRGEILNYTATRPEIGKPKK
jgi:hypothetical protein